MRRNVILLLVLALAAFAVGCSKKQSSEEANSATEAAKGDGVAAPVAAGNAVCEVTSDAEIEAREWVEANNAFGLRLLAGESGNAVVSPFSAERALGMVHDGACNDTAREMRTAMSMPDARNLSAAGHEVEDAMLGPARENDNVTVHVENRVYAGTPLMDDYAARLRADYGAVPESVDFAGDPDGVRRHINDDVARATEDKIRDLIAPGTLTPLTKLVLTNAVYFKAPWFHQFVKGATNKADFRTDGGTVQVDMMHHVKKHGYVRADDCIAFTLEFHGGYALMIMMPRDTGDVVAALRDFESTLTAQKLRDLRDRMASEELRLSMPKFRIETTVPLTQRLKDLGMHKAFVPDEADFSRMTDKHDLYISAAIQKAYIAIDEEGAEAAAATAIVMTTRMAHRPSQPIEVTVDRPFVYALLERETGAALFLGRVVKP